MSTTPPEVLQLARQGQPSAIAALMNLHLESKGITAYVSQQGNLLQVVLEASGVPIQSKLVNYVKIGISRLGLTTVDHLSVSGKQQGSTNFAWTEMVQMREGAPSPSDILSPELDELDFDAVDNALDIDIDHDLNLDLPNLDLGLLDESTGNDLDFGIDLLENTSTDLSFCTAETTHTTSDPDFDPNASSDTNDVDLDLNLELDYPTDELDLNFDEMTSETSDYDLIEEERGVDFELEALAPMDLGALDLEEDLWGDTGTTEASDSSAFATPNLAEPEFSPNNTSFETETLGEDAFELPDLNEEALTEELPFGTMGLEEESLGVEGDFKIPDFGEELPFGTTGFKNDDLGADNSFSLPNFEDDLPGETLPFGWVDTEALTDDMEPLDSEAIDATEEEFSFESPLAEETFEESLEPGEEFPPISWNEEDISSAAAGNRESVFAGDALGGAALGGDNTNGFHQDEATDDADDADDFIHKFAPVSLEEVDQRTPGKAGAGSSLKRIMGLGAGALALLLAVFGVTTLLGRMRQPGGPVTPPPVETPTPPDDGTELPTEPPTEPTEPPPEPPVSTNPFRDAVNAATQASQLTQTASTKEEWQAVADGWQQAITLMEQVPESDPNYAKAQDRAVAYQPNWAYAQQNVQRFP